MFPRALIQILVGSRVREDEDGEEVDLSYRLIIENSSSDHIRIDRLGLRRVSHGMVGSVRPEDNADVEIIV